MSPRPSARHRLAGALLLGSLAAAGLPLSVPAVTADTARSTTAARPAVAAAAVDPGIRPFVAQRRPLGRVVYGYLPYWNLDSATAGRLQYDLLSTIAFFGLGIKADGTIDTAWRGYTAYMSDDAIAVTNAAHAAGVRVVPTFQLFDSGSLRKMIAFLGSTAAQDRFIGQALALMTRRSADGANLDFEPVPAAQASGFVAFVARFRTALKVRFPSSTLVVATSAGAGAELVTGLVPLVDQMFVMTYGYNTTTAKVAGAMAPLDSAARTVKIHIARYLTRAPASKIILGIGYYGYDWPVTSSRPNATVQAKPSAYGGARSVTYGAARAWLAAHPSTIRHEDTTQGSAWFTYYDSAKKTYRQVYFEDEYSIAAKDDYALASGLAGVGIWTLGNDRTYGQLWNTLRRKFYSPTYAATVSGWIRHVTADGRYVYATILRRVRNTGDVPQRGILHWVVRDSHGRSRASGSTKISLYPNQSAARRATFRIGSRTALPAGRYTLLISFSGAHGTWRAAPIAFRQSY
jgi:Glycosyl hydrolases family 18